MARVVLPGHLRRKLPSDVDIDSLEITASNWSEFVAEIRDRFPGVAEKLITKDGGLGKGFLLAQNDEVLPHEIEGSHHFSQTDVLTVVAALAGG